MSLPKTEADAMAVADRVLKRVEVSKIARRLQDRLALAQFKTKNGWEDLTLDKIEPKVEEERRRRRLAAASEFEHTSDISSTVSDFPYSRMANGLMSSPLKAPAPLFRDAILTPSASGSGTGRGQRKRSYMISFNDDSNSGPGPVRTLFNPAKRVRAESPTAHKSFLTGHATWKDLHQLAQSSPIKPRKHHRAPARAPTNKKAALKQSHVLQPSSTASQPVEPLKTESHFMTTHSGDPLFSTSLDDTLTSPPFTLTMSDDDEDDVPLQSFNVQSSPPSTPPLRARSLNRLHIPENILINPLDMNSKNNGTDETGLLMYLANSPNSKRRPSTTTLAMITDGNPAAKREPPHTPPPKNSMLPSSLMTTPGGSNLFNTPGQTFDFADYVNITPSPAQKTWTRTPIVLPGGARTPLSVKRLEFPSEFR